MDNSNIECEDRIEGEWCEVCEAQVEKLFDQIFDVLNGFTDNRVSVAALAEVLGIVIGANPREAGNTLTRVFQSRFKESYRAGRQALDERAAQSQSPAIIVPSNGATN